MKSWFYAALAGTDKNPDNDMARSFETFLDGPNQLIIETEPELVVSFQLREVRGNDPISERNVHASAAVTRKHRLAPRPELSKCS